MRSGGGAREGEGWALLISLQRRGMPRPLTLSIVCLVNYRSTLDRQEGGPSLPPDVGTVHQPDAVDAHHSQRRQASCSTWLSVGPIPRLMSAVRAGNLVAWRWCLTERYEGRLKVNSCGFTISACSLISEQSINQLSMSRVLRFPLHVPYSGKP